MNTPQLTDPAKELAAVTITLFQVICGLVFCLSVYMIYLAYLGLLTDWEFSIRFTFFRFSPEENSRIFHMLFFVFPAAGALIGFFILAYLKRVIHKE